MDSKLQMSTELLLLLDVRNAGELRTRLTLSSEPSDALLRQRVVLVKARLVCDAMQLRVAAHKAMLAEAREKMFTRTIGAEVLLLLSPSTNISQSLKTFGIADNDDSLVAVIMKDCDGEANRRLREVADARFVDEENVDSKLKNLADLNAIRKIHKVSDGVSIKQLSSLVVSKTAAKDMLL